MLKAYTIPNDTGIHDALISGYQSAFRAIFITLAGLGVVAFFLAFTLIPQISLRRHDDYKYMEKRPWEHNAKPKPPVFLPPKAAFILGISNGPKSALSK